MKFFQVGGSVRDELLGFRPKDRDWVVINSSPNEMEQNGFKPIGKDFPVFLHPDTNEEYALARTERKSGVGYKGFKFYFDSTVTLEEDLQRRDFTINAIAKDQNGKIIDPYNGRQDLKNKTFRHTSPAFSEDPLRLLRFARFKSYEQLHDFKLHKTTEVFFDKIVSSGELANLSAERVWIETKKSLENKHTENFFKIIMQYQITSPWFSNLNSIACDGLLPEMKWADMQRINGFKLSQLLPIPKSFQKILDCLKQVIEMIESKDPKEKIYLIEKMNIHRNYEIFRDIQQLFFLQEHQQYLQSIYDSVMAIDFSVLAEVDTSDVSYKKQLLYYEALQNML